MRYTRAFIHTFYETPKEAETPSHIFLLRGSYIYPVAAGIYTLLPLGHRVAEKIKKILREEMDGIEGQEVTMPVVNPAELWKKTKRYYDIGPELFRFHDRKNREFVLAMTHEEVITDVAKQFIKSYRDMPVMLYQIQTKVRDEARPRGGLLRVREFTMKDGYSFHPDFEDLDRYYPRVYNAYLRIFARCGLEAIPIEADTGIMGGTGSHEFMLPSDYGEDRFVTCSHCSYRANTEKAVGEKKVPENLLNENPPPVEEVSTPGITTIAQLMDFFGISREGFLKTVAYEADGKLVIAAIRGDFDISETKLANRLKAVKLELASEETLREKGLYGGFLSPVGLKGKVTVIVDESATLPIPFIAGGNKPDVHLKNVLYGRDFQADDVADIAEVREGDTCLQCREGTLSIKRGIELGHTFKLGIKYTAEDTMDVQYLDSQGNMQRVVMGCYGIGVERLMAAVVERWHDDAGIIWPVTVAPYQVILIPIGQRDNVLNTAQACYEMLKNRFEVLWDDRNESPGVKFKDADLLGIPLRVVVSQRLLESNSVEIKVRKTGEIFECPVNELVARLESIIKELTPQLEGLPYMEEEQI
ncbi:proline--tRNA ligase [Thermodesulforhabdus norvegica]|uniref:Proline--tRNA ligase n=1 Tax=Thermodesulforhabdus norvegica TaxID=39841 RepID=A0A1I4TXG2_9BACT|nr:proline--tRNA ligase [Thermodesulforhabdus norvegica]SFM81251.1 prolyl-tRNA synthetase [Thermodesulforhabdus norvegica]